LPPATELEAVVAAGVVVKGLVAEGVVAEGLDEVPSVELLLPASLLLPLNEIIANSSLPDEGLTMASLIVPISLPEEPVT
jgi:hypothetical protein